MIHGKIRETYKRTGRVRNYMETENRLLCEILETRPTIVAIVKHGKVYFSCTKCGAQRMWSVVFLEAFCRYGYDCLKCDTTYNVEWDDQFQQ